MAVYVSDLFTATPAPVDANPTATRTFQWLRGSTAISGATSSTYTAVTADIGSSLSTTQFETNFLSSVTATSASTEVVQAFDPIRLFSSSEPGVWYDPNDAANLDWRRNLLLQTDQFESSTWTKLATTVTANAAAAPDGTMTADKIIASAASGEHGIYQTTSGTTGTVYVVAKAAEYTNLRMGELGNYWFYASFDLITGVVSGTGGPRFSSAYMVSLGDGWWQCVIKHTSVGTVPFTFGGFPTGATGFALANFTGNGTSGVFVAQSQAEQGTVATEYQPITDLNTEVIARFPNATLYQDATGSIPVTTPGQTVALMLDKSRGSDLGPDRITNGDFSNGSTGWSLGANWAVSGGAAVATASSGNINQVMAGIVVGRPYLVEFDVTVSSGSLRAELGGSFGPTVTSSGRYRAILTSLTGAVSVLYIYGPTAFTGTVDNISVKEVPGLHATQPTLASRPTYGIVPTGGRRNLLVQTEAFGSASWTTGSVVISSDSQTAPDGTLTADTATYAGQFNSVNQNVSLAANTYTLSYWLKAGTGTNPLFFGFFNGTWNTGTSATPTSSWVRHSYTFTSAVPITQILIAQDRASSGFGSAYIWGAQLEIGSTATAYQKVTTQYDVTEAGVPSLGYLFFDGVNDFMVTPTITPGIDKAQVFAGVRKLSDAALGMLVELSASRDANLGTFDVRSDGGGSWSSLSHGTAAASSTQNVTTAVYTAPESSVLSALHDIAGDSTRLRRNSIEPAAATGDKGAGNFGVYPIYIGRRGGTDFPFQGHIHSLIVRFGPNLTTARIAATETWVASKTAGVTL